MTQENCNTPPANVEIQQNDRFEVCDASTYSHDNFLTEIPAVFLFMHFNIYRSYMFDHYVI